MSGDAHVYYNIVMTNNTSGTILAQWEDQRTEPIVQDVENYHLAVIKFIIPTSQLPIIQDWPVGAGATAQNTGYSITLVGTGGTASQQFIIYTPIDVQTETSYIFQYVTLINMINNAFSAAAVAIGLTGANTAPFITLNTASQLFSIYVPTIYNTYGFEIWFNINFQLLFPSFPILYFNTSGSFSNSGKYAKLNILPLNNPNSTPIASYNEVIQEYASTTSLYVPRSLRFVTGRLQVRPETIPQITVNGNNNNTQTILTDFDLPLSSAVADIKPFVQYYQVGPYRYIDLKTQGPLTYFDLQIFWVDSIGRIEPLYLDPGQSATIKCMFVKKN